MKNQKESLLMKDFEGASEDKILEILKEQSDETIENLADLYDYKWDENESTSRNLRELAETIYTKNSF